MSWFTLGHVAGSSLPRMVSITPFGPRAVWNGRVINPTGHPSQQGIQRSPMTAWLRMDYSPVTRLNWRCWFSTFPSRIGLSSRVTFWLVHRRYRSVCESTGPSVHNNQSHEVARTSPPTLYPYGPFRNSSHDRASSRLAKKQRSGCWWEKTLSNGRRHQRRGGIVLWKWVYRAKTRPIVNHNHSGWVR